VRLARLAGAVPDLGESESSPLPRRGVPPSNRVQELKMYDPSCPAYGFARKNLPATIRKALAEGVSPLMRDL
jgi:hypothetical protein